MSEKIAASRLHAALDEIINNETEAVVLISSDGSTVYARSFGDYDEALWAVNETYIAIECQTWRPDEEVYCH